MSAYKILIVEDDAPIAELLAYRLRKEGYDTGIAGTGAKALQLAAGVHPDLILLDWQLPDISGLEVCRRVNMVEDKVLGLEAGADDYITKPFDVREVVARIKATFRRLEKTGETPPVRSELQLHFAGLTVTPATMTVERRGKPVDLTPLEYQLLMYFYENRNVALSREKILEAVWGYDYFGNTRTVDIHVLRLRKKLGLDTEIRTIFKIGYIFDIKE